MAATLNAMSVDSVEEDNPENKPIINPNPIASDKNDKTDNSPPKRRKKRTREEMETDNNDTSITTNSLDSKHHKRRKITTVTTPNAPDANANVPSAKWSTKMAQYSTIIKSTYKQLCSASANTNNEMNLNLLYEEASNEVNNKCSDNITAPNFDLKPFIASICKLSYAKHDALTTLVLDIRDVLLNGIQNVDDSLRTNLKDNIRVIILSSMTRKLYGIKPPKSANKNEERIENEVDLWNKCRMYQWEAFDIQHIPKQYRLDLKDIKKYNTLMTKYAAFCKKYETFYGSKASKLSADQKDSELQKIDDAIVSWKSKQELMERQRAIKEAQIQQRKEKKEEMERLKKEKEKRKKEKEEKKKTPQKNKTKQRKPSFMDRFLVTNKLKSITPDDDAPNKSLYERVFRAPKAGEIRPITRKITQQIIDIKDNELLISDNNYIIMHQVRLQCKFRQFHEDYRPSFFAIGIFEKDLNIVKLCRNPFAKIVSKIRYNEEDSGVEWYEDIDDLENCEDLEEEEEDLEENHLRIRDDGFENDRFIVNTDDDEDGEALNDKDMMQNIQKSNELRDRLKNEYPIKFVHKRQRGDEIDAPIRIRLPDIKRIRMKAEHNALYNLTHKKGSFVVEIKQIKHEENENDLKHLLSIENKDNPEKEKEKEKKKEKKKKKKKEKKKKRKKLEEEIKELEEKKKSMKMEMDASDDEDVDVKMVQSLNINTPLKLKPKKATNTLNKYFKTKPKVKANPNTNANPVKKRRVVMCELVEE